MSIRHEIQTAATLAIAAAALNKAANHPGMTGKNFRRCQRAFDSRTAEINATLAAPVLAPRKPRAKVAKPATVATVKAPRALSNDPRAVAKRNARAAAKLATV